MLFARAVFLLLVAGSPALASAGIFSAVSGMFSSNASSVSASADSLTSQNMPVLKAVIGPSPNSGRGGGEITVVDDSALLPESGPSGAFVNMEENHSDQISIYVVREGDTLSGIAKMFGVSVNTVMWANDVTPRALRPGDQLVILPISGLQYRVKSGDTLKSIAAKYKADMSEIIQFNDLKANSPLSVGETIIIPDAELETPKATTPASKVRGNGGPSYAGYYGKPLASYVKTQGLHGYNGVDLAAPAGTAVMAAAAGEVIVSKSGGWNGGYGAYIVVSHGNGTQTLYSHLSENVTYQGMKVFQGQVIGYVGSSGKSTGSHLHFEIRGAKNPF